jgi:hypothetical protein
MLDSKVADYELDNRVHWLAATRNVSSQPRAVLLFSFVSSAGPYHGALSEVIKVDGR